MKHIQLIVSDEAFPQVMLRLAPFADSIFVESTDRKSFAIVGATTDIPALAAPAPIPEQAPVAPEARRTRPRPAKSSAKDTAKKWGRNVPGRPTAREVVQKFLASGEAVHLVPIREELTRLGFQRNAASSVMLNLVEKGEVKRVGEATYQNVLREPAQVAAG